MIQRELYISALEKYRSWYKRDPEVAAYAPGRVEILGNHTDYNEGYVLSAAINFGTFFLASRVDTSDTCRIVAGDLMEEVAFSISNPGTVGQHHWPNYVIGVAAELSKQFSLHTPFDGLFFGNVPLGSGLSSSAALEISTALGLCALNRGDVPMLDLARIGQRAEHEYVGAKTGLLDQISSLNGKKDFLVMSDFRTLGIDTVPLPADVCFLVCDTGTSHSLGESDYNTRRAACERATVFFGARLSHPVSALRDVSMKEWQECQGEMDPEDASRSAHVIGENTRVLEGRKLLADGRIEDFGELMFQSHESSKSNFENSCEELDTIVDAAASTSGVLGARLSGGGFGGSAVVLLRPAKIEAVSTSIAEQYRRETGKSLKTHVIEASQGAFSFNPRDEA